MSLTPTDLRCEGFASPAVSDRPNPRLTWALEGKGCQTAYQIEADGWDTGRVATSRQDAPYDGPPPEPWRDVAWRVRVWDEAGAASDWAEASWDPGLAGGPWPGAWIGSPAPPPATAAAFYEDRPNPLLRREFAVRPGLRRARIAVCGLGYYELRLNGAKVGDALLEPAWTPYAKRVFYRVYELNGLREGANALGIELGNGWWNPLPMTLFGAFDLREHLAVGEPCARAVLRLEYADGTVETLATDEAWQAGEGPILRDNVYLGETYDATRETPGWDLPGFAGGWPPAIVKTGPAGIVETAPLPPIRVRERVAARSVDEVAPGVWIVDFGGNLAGVVEARFRAPRGTRITMRFGERRHPDGSLNVLTSCAGQIKAGVCRGGPAAPETADQRAVYVCRGDGEEVYAPRFAWHGFRYMEVTGLPEPPRAEDFTALWLNTAADLVGTFECDDALLNDVHRISVAALKSNLFSVQSDCPHRERLGYGADIAATTEFAMATLDLEGFYAKAAGDFADDASDDGGMPETAPYVGIADRGFGGRTGSVGWGIAHAALVRDHYRRYGNIAHVARHFDAMRSYLDFLERHAPDGIVADCIGDHESVAPLPRSLTATAHYHQQAATVAWAAGLLGHDAAPYAARADAIRDAFHARFYDPRSGDYDFGSQACQAFPLWHGLVPAEREGRVFACLLGRIEADGFHLTTGIYGTRYLLDVLSRRGRADLAHRLVAAKGYPGYAFMLEHGATTLWESWKRDERISSHNHPMFGSVVEWLYAHVAGLAPADDADGFDRAVVRPQPVGGLRRAAAGHRTWRGTFGVAWHVEEGAFRLSLVVPPNARASVTLPDGTGREVGDGRHEFACAFAGDSQ